VWKNNSMSMATKLRLFRKYDDESDESIGLAGRETHV